MKIEISIDCVDDTGRIPKGQIIIWKLQEEGTSRDAKLKIVGDLVIEALKKRYPKPRDGVTKVGKIKR